MRQSANHLRNSALSLALSVGINLAALVRRIRHCIGERIDGSIEHRHASDVGLHFAHYNFVRQHKSLRVTPAMAAGVSDRMWSLEELVERTGK
jgi:hypothetical protein